MLKTDRLAIRPFRADDAAAFAAYRSDPEVARRSVQQEVLLRRNTWIKGEWTDDLLFGLLADDPR